MAVYRGCVPCHLSSRGNEKTIKMRVKLKKAPPGSSAIMELTLKVAYILARSQKANDSPDWTLIGRRNHMWEELSNQTVYIHNLKLQRKKKWLWQIMTSSQLFLFLTFKVSWSTIDCANKYTRESLWTTKRLLNLEKSHFCMEFEWNPFRFFISYEIHQIHFFIRYRLL